MNIVAVIGNESHSTSSGWGKISINGKSLTFRDASSKEWISTFGDKHARWCECVFQVKSGDKVAWEAGSNAGSRGANRTRQNLNFVVGDESTPIYESEEMPYPAADAKIKGRLILAADENAKKTARHNAMTEAL